MKNYLKRALSILLALILLVGTVPMSSFALDNEMEVLSSDTSDDQIVESAEDNTDKLSTTGTSEEDVIEDPYATIANPDDYECKEVTDGLEITAYKGSDYIVAVPDTINGKAVVSIGANTFKDNTKVIEIMIPDGVKSIGDTAFSGCTELYSVLISSTVETIADNAFSGVETVKVLCYFNSAAYTYAQTKAMKYIRIYDSTVVEDGGESGTQSSWHLNLVTGLFVVYGTVMPNYSSSGATPWYDQIANIKAIRIIDGITNIGNNAFSGCSNASNGLIIPDSVTTIGSSAFYGCNKITGLELGEGITNIGSSAFSGCSGLKGDLTIPDTVTSLGNSAFNNCTGLTGRLKLSETLKNIPYYCFYNCQFSGELIIPDSVESISSDYVFRNCNNITSIIFGEGLKTVYYNAFYGCNSVKEVTFKGTNVPGSDFISYLNSVLETVYVPAEAYSAYVSAFSSYKGKAEISCDTLKANIKNLKAYRYSESIKLSWSAHMNERVESYVVLRNGEQIATTTDLFYVDKNLDKGTYTYSVYGLTAENEQTGTASVTAATSTPELTKIYTNHTGNCIGVTDGKIYVSAKNNDNYLDLDGKEITGVMYYLVDGRREIVGESKLVSGSSSTSTLVYVVDWNVDDIEAGEYDVVFVIRDVDGAEAEISGKVNVDKSVPEKIINVVAVGDYTNINVSWSQSNEVDSTTYKVYRKSEVDTKYFLVKTISSRTTLTYKDTNVKEDRTYYYYVVTVNSFGTESEPSDVAVAKRAKDLEKPTVTKFTPATYSYITGIQTVTVAAVDNLMLASAKLYYSLDEGATWTLVGEDTSVPFNFSFNTTEFNDGVITMKAVAYDAEHNESEPMTVTYSIDNSGPEKVTGLSAKEVHTSQLTLQWNDVTADDAACFILQQKNGKDYETIARSITTLGYNLSNLRPNTSYTYRVAAVDVRGNIGEYSESLTVMTTEDTTAPVVTSLAPSPGRYSNSISFKASAGDDCGIKAISIQTSTDRTNWETVSTAEFATYSKTATYSYNVSLAGYNDGSLYIRAVAEDYSGNTSDTSDSAAFVEYMVDKSAPNTPRDLVASGGYGWIYISWIQGEEEDLGTYSLYRSTSENGTYQLIASNLKTISYYDNTALRDTVYYYKLRAIDTTGNISDFSDVVSAKVADDIEAPEVVNINPASGSFVGPAYSTVEALVKDNNCIDSIVIEYRINNDSEFKTLKEFNKVGYYYTTVRTSLPITELEDGDKIYIRVYAN